MAPFALNYKKLLKLVKNNLIENKQLYEQEIYGDFLVQANSCVSSISENYDKYIL